MKYFVRTGHGELEEYYCGLQNIPFQGTCQGNGASPVYWLIISMLMVIVMHKKEHSMLLKYPITDDTDLIVIVDDKKTGIDLR